METTDYSGMFVYKDDHIDYINTSEGRLKWDDQHHLFYPEYFIKDHLGNVRSVVTSNPGQTLAIQGTDYYPFGLEIPVYGNDDNQTKYNSKELQIEADLDWYDYGARFYDPMLARWHSVDPMTETSRRWSPYTYCMNNPIRFIDPDGNYEIDAKTAQKYPQFAAYLKNISQTYANKPQAFRETFKAYSQLSDKQITLMLTYGQGPMITVANLDNGNVKINGQNVAFKDASTGKITNANNGKGSIKLDDDVVGKYENASTQLDKQAGEVLVESTLIHESVHFGDYASDGTKNTSITKPDGTVDTFTEIGKAFENAAYGQDISRGNVDQYVKNRQLVKSQIQQAQLIPVKKEELQLQAR